ncbi:hypothetical protein [Actinomadura sp. 3N407]|uniref:hypothetical protein n=1 Tax=Actinomadura sp. 3N407 TaxID=3457423 RepID=UPI003FCC33B7
MSLTAAPPNLEIVVDVVVDAIHGPDTDLQIAGAMVEEFGQAHPDLFDDLIIALGAASIPEPGTIVVGPAQLLFNNPLREGWVWRCGAHHPCAGVNYSNSAAAHRAAGLHADETPGLRVREIYA